jgi:hypothetical protein
MHSVRENVNDLTQFKYVLDYVAIRQWWERFSKLPALAYMLPIEVRRGSTSRLSEVKEAKLNLRFVMVTFGLHLFINNKPFHV